MNQPFFSILIPCYNAEKYIKIALESCINQRYQDFEILLVDNGSNDNTINILEKIDYNKLTCFFGKNKVNDIDLRNFLIKKAQGKYIVWLEPFDKLTPFFLEEAYNVLKYQDYDILEFSMIWSHNDGTLDVSSINDCDFINSDCIDLYLERYDELQDMFAGKVFSSKLMKSVNVEPVNNVHEYAECFYSLPLYANAVSYKSFPKIFVYDYHFELPRNKKLEEINVENIKTLCRIRNEQLNRNIQILKDKNIYEQYALYVLNKLYLYNIFQNMLKMEKLEDRKEVFKEFYKYFTIQLSANIFMENNNESD